MEYGPITGDQLRAWIAEGRVNAQTPVQAEGDTTWKPLSTFPELSLVLPAAPQPALFAAPAGDSDGRARALSQVTGPAIGLIVVVSIGIFFAIAGIILQAAGVAMGSMNNYQNQNLPPEFANMMAEMSGTMGIVIKAIGILVGILIIYGSIKMKKLESYGLAITVSILAMLPCLSPCCCLGLPIGIWALVILSKADVKKYFS